MYNKLSPFQRVLIVLVLGILTGIIVGEPAGRLEIGGTIYIRLLQMTVLPYVLVSIISGLGRLDSNMAAKIGIKAVKIILFIWLAAMLTTLLLPFGYPSWETSGFFSSGMATETARLNFVDLYIPSNIFASLSETIVPAVVLFSLLMGVALINVKNKKTFITLADNIVDGLQTVASYIAKLSPLGIFAIAAAAAGTLQPEELERLQVFLWIYIIAAILLVFILLPFLIQWATPFSYRELMSIAGEAVVTAMATGTVLVVLPMIAERCKELLKKHGMDCEATDSTVDVMVPTAYSFPSVGSLLGLGFILFSAWYVGAPLGVEDYFSYVVMGAFSAFGSMAVAIPFLLDYFALPADQFQLYLLGSVVTARVATGLAALHGFVVTLLVASAVLNKLSWRKMLQAFALHLGISAGVMILAGVALTNLISYEYTGDRTFEAMQLKGHAVKVTRPTKLAALSPQQQKRPRLDIIRERGSLRVGYFSDNLPYAFINDKGTVVGLDMDIMHELARDLKITLELTHVKNKKEEIQMLFDGRLDITVGGIAITPERAVDMAFSHAYTNHTGGLMMTDAKRDKFSDMESINAMEKLNLAVLDSAYYKKSIAKIFPNATLTTIKTPREFFMNKHPDIDAFVFSAEAGSAWAMLFPAYSSVVPKGLKLKAPVGFGLPKGQFDFTQFINTWILLKKDNAQLDGIYDYWILGLNPEAKKPRWSVIRNVFGWDI
ncbi:MAG: cation:dicarboxylase symporter family transporter [Gammaproteobacteria bacterium]|nr:MAG: cation:dicarboxylase symporter family transporter [Gammaproteobacteria bacterium]